MRTINEVASWFKKNNILAIDDDLRVKILTLYTKVAYTVLNKELECEELSLDNHDLNIGITNMNKEAQFDKDELQILNTINHVYGYDELKYLILPLTDIQVPTLKEIIKCLRQDILYVLESYENYHFNDYVLIYNDNVFFVDNNTNLTEEEKQMLAAVDDINQDTFVVFRNENDGKLVIY